MLDTTDLMTMMDIRDALIDFLTYFKEFLKIEKERLELEKARMGRRD